MTGAAAEAPGCPFDPAVVDGRFDIYDPTVAAHLDAILHHVRETTPVTRSTANGGYVLTTTYDDVATVLGDNDIYSSKGGKSIPTKQHVDMPPLDSDPPEHREYRRLLNRFFSKAGLAKHEPAIRGIARDLLDGFVEQGEVEALRDYATAMTGAVLCRVILNLEDADLQRTAQERVSRLVRTNAPEDWAALTDFIGGLVRDGRSGEQDDVFNAIVTGTIDGRALTDMEKLGLVIVLFLAGLDTTRTEISCIIRHIALTPGLEQRLRDTDWTRSDLDEFLRMDSVVSGLARTVRQETELNGVRLYPGEKVLVHYYAANHDPAVFPNPDELDFARSRNPHVAFGVGIHRCLGSNLARLQIRVAIEELLARVENIRPVPGADLDFAPGISRQPNTVHIAFDKR